MQLFRLLSKNTDCGLSHISSLEMTHRGGENRKGNYHNCQGLASSPSPRGRHPQRVFACPSSSPPFSNCKSCRIVAFLPSTHPWFPPRECLDVLWFCAFLSWWAHFVNPFRSPLKPPFFDCSCCRPLGLLIIPNRNPATMDQAAVQQAPTSQGGAIGRREQSILFAYKSIVALTCLMDALVTLETLKKMFKKCIYLITYLLEKCIFFKFRLQIRMTQDEPALFYCDVKFLSVLRSQKQLHYELGWLRICDFSRSYQQIWKICLQPMGKLPLIISVGQCRTVWDVSLVTLSNGVFDLWVLRGWPTITIHLN